MVTSTCTLPAVMPVVLTSHFLRGLLLVLLSGPFGRAYQRLHPNASGVCQPHTCANHTRTAGPQDCNGDDQCIWNSSAATPCEPFACSNLQTAQACGNFSRRDCSWDEAHGCSGGWDHNSPPNIWRDTVTNMMDGYWYSTQTVGHCNTTETETETALSEPGAEQCTWRVAEVSTVVRSDCVNGQIIDAVVKRNSSCFNALPNSTDRTTDGWIECFFNSLLGNHSTNQPSIGGTVLNSDADVSKLRQTVLDLWLSGFNGACPAVASNNTADPPGTASPKGLDTLTLYTQGSAPASNLTNRNSKDAAAIVADALHVASLLDLCAVYGGEACEEAEQQTALTTTGTVLTAAKVTLNTLHGQFADCSIINGSYQCFARWECWCEHGWNNNGGNGLPSTCGDIWDVHHDRYLNGTVFKTIRLPENGSLVECCEKCGKEKSCDGWQMGNISSKPHTHCNLIKHGSLLDQDSAPMIASVSKSDNNNQPQNPCLQNSDGGDDYCPCLTWGGCGGGQWGKPLANGALAVGRRTNVAALSHSAPAGHEYSTTAGGECGSAENQKGYSICTWKAESAEQWPSADAACVRAALAVAMEAAVVGCRAECGTRRGQCWLDCATTERAAALAAAHLALADAFAPDSACLVV